jgi:hypothetical protein
MSTIRKLIFTAQYPLYTYEEVIEKLVDEEWKEKLGLDNFVKKRY